MFYGKKTLRVFLGIGRYAVSCEPRVHRAPHYPLGLTGAGGLMECSTSTTAKQRDVIARVFWTERHPMNQSVE